MIAQQRKFLAAYARLGVITAAAIEAGVDRHHHYEWLADTEKYPEYEPAFRDAFEQAADVLEEEARRRGHDGWDEPQFGRLPGKDAGEGQIGVVRKYSDRMLELLLKSRRPKVFRERLAVGGDPDAPPVQTASKTDLAKMTTEELALLASLIAKAKGKKAA